MKKYFVYIHTNNTNNKKYIGITKQTPERRWKNGYGYRIQKHFYRAIEKYGWDNFSHQVFEVDTESEMYYLEKYLISYYNTTNPILGYNKSKGGEKSCLGVKRSNEFRIKDSITHKGKINSEETRKRISQGLRTSEKRNYLKVKIVQLTLDGVPVKEWNSITDAELYGGFSSGHICQCCKGKRGNHGGYIWKYAS